MLCDIANCNIKYTGNLKCNVFSIGVTIRCCFDLTIPHSQLGYHVMERLKLTGEELRHADETTALVVKQVSKTIRQANTVVGAAEN